MSAATSRFIARNALKRPVKSALRLSRRTGMVAFRRVSSQKAHCSMARRQIAVNPLLSCHCERSEAIQSVSEKTGLLRRKGSSQ
jgi:hypothetical protein